MNQTLRLKCQRDAHLIPWKVLVATDSRRWPWKSEPAKECVTTHLPSQLALKMDGAIKDTVKVGRSPRWLVRLDARGTLDSVSIGRAWNIGQRWAPRNSEIARNKSSKTELSLAPKRPNFPKKISEKPKFSNFFFLKNPNFPIFFSEKPKFFPGKMKIFKKKNLISWIFDFFFFEFFQKNFSNLKKNSFIILKTPPWIAGRIVKA